mmetsp:Transcript_94371/g.163129  ORF Transcript_94371/g.163129 Transcript_94371/m.163129 type:complete len:93 (-) Transcript_94371:1235-1513(-)
MWQLHHHMDLSPQHQQHPGRISLLNPRRVFLHSGTLQPHFLQLLVTIRLLHTGQCHKSQVQHLDSITPTLSQRSHTYLLGTQTMPNPAAQEH